MSNSIRSLEVSNKTLKKGPRNGGLPQGSISSSERESVTSTPEAVVESLVSHPEEIVNSTVEVLHPETFEAPASVDVSDNKETTSSTVSTSTTTKKKR